MNGLLARVICGGRREEIWVGPASIDGWPPHIG